MGNFADGFFIGTMFGDNSDEWQDFAHKAKTKIKKLSAEVERLSEEVENLSEELEIERKRVFVERRNRQNYMRWWAGRGDILRELVNEGRFTKAEWNEKAERIDHEKDAEYLKMRDEADRRIEQEVENL